MRKIHYIGWYIDERDDNCYTGAVPAKLKMRYVSKKIIEAGTVPCIFSLAEKKVLGFYRSCKKVGINGEKIKYTGGFNGKGKIAKKLGQTLKKIQFAKYIICDVKKDDIIMLYHSVPFTKLLSKISPFFNRFVICEVEEVYGYSATEDKPWINNEIKYIKAVSDKYMVVNDGIKEDFKLDDNTAVVSYGVVDIPERKTERFDDGKIHIVYAGTIENKKLGAMTAIEVAPLLSDRYAMHILGFGNEQNLNILKKRINEINAISKCKVSYDGYKKGDELSQFLFKCHIGLSSNVMRPNFANNTFPSKVITYMCHDLAVVLGYAKAFYDVPISQKWSFFMDYSPQSIADAITKIDVPKQGEYTDILNLHDKAVVDFIRGLI